MKIAYFHCFAGASGDMILGAMLDAGLSFEQLKADLAKLPLPLRSFRLEVSRVTKQGIRATKVDVLVEDKQTHRRLGDIKAIIDKSVLPAIVQERSMGIFTRLAEAEAKVHGKSVEEIIFHEVGAVDAIVDVVGAAIGFWRLGIEEVYASPVHVGGGVLETAHGVLPVPLPATMELLRGVPAYSRGVERELLTPTGAAILTVCCRAFGDMPPLNVINSGYGAGNYDLAIPNLLRLTIGEKVTGAASSLSAETESGCHEVPALMMETNIDDMNPEFYDYLISRLLEAGAMDVFLQTIQMKKNRPAVTLSVLMRPEDLDAFREQIFAETTTLGVRVYPVTKHMLPSEIITMETGLGQARVKIGRRQGKICNVAPEYEDCRKLAKENKMPMKNIYDLIKAEAWRKLT
ncbi:MAG: nickel pincer cofactor biosynthesis protein LarC [Syntrophales bacterium]|nr:nickel pincer cofactor biosynthesis protein LarC [Syntrophales bacterium]